MMRRLFLHFPYIFSVLLLALVSATSLYAQSIFGTISGSVRDESGAVVPNANITLKNSSSGTIRRAVSNADGFYSFVSVPVGGYSLIVDATGFLKSQIDGISVTGSSSQTFTNN